MTYEEFEELMSQEPPPDWKGWAALVAFLGIMVFLVYLALTAP